MHISPIPSLHKNNVGATPNTLNKNKSFSLQLYSTTHPDSFSLFLKRNEKSGLKSHIYQFDDHFIIVTHIVPIMPP